MKVYKNIKNSKHKQQILIQVFIFQVIMILMNNKVIEQ